MKTFVSILVLMLSFGSVQAQNAVTYNEGVTTTVAGSSPTDTYSANVAALAQRLEAAATAVRSGKETIVLSSRSPLVTDILNAAVQLRTTAYVADAAINGLGVYSQKKFYENAPAQSKAAEDQGKQAASVLRQIVPGGT